MTHNKDCKCINCQAKGKPIREIWLRSVTAKELSEIEVFDWLEGFGLIDSLAMQKYVHKYGFLIIKEVEKAYELAESYRIAFENHREKILTTFLLDNLFGKTDYLNIKAERKNCFRLLSKSGTTEGCNLDLQVEKLLKLVQLHKDNLRGALESRAADWGRIKDLEKQNESYSERVHSLEDENGRYFEQICRLETIIDKLTKQIPDKNPE